MDRSLKFESIDLNVTAR